MLKNAIQIDIKHLKRCSKSLVTREIQIKTTMKYYLKSTRIAIIKTNSCTIVDKDVEKLEHLYSAGGNVKW